MKKIKIIAFILPILAIAVFVALQSFQQKEKASNRLDDPQWFTLNTGGTETNPAHYSPAPGYDPSANGCEGSYHMCAVLALPNSSNSSIPQLNIVSGKVAEGGPVEQVARTETP